MIRKPAPARTLPRTVVDSTHLTRFIPLPGLSRRDPYLLRSEKEPGTVRAWLNGSSIVFKGKRLLAYRTEMKQWWMWSRLHMVELDEHFQPVLGTNRMLNVPTRFDAGDEFWGAEDPRLFVFQDRLHMAYGDGYRMLLARFNDDLTVERAEYFPAGEPLPDIPQASHREKNWGFFSIGDRLFAQQHISDQWILEFDPETWTPVNKWRHDWRWASPHGVEVHGGSLPVLHDGVMHRFVHTHRKLPLPNPRKVWYSTDLLREALVYSVYHHTFEAEPPFRPISLTKDRILWTDFSDEEEDIPTPHAVVFVGSAEREGDGWRLFYGENDARVVTQVIPDTMLEERQEIAYKTPRPWEPGELRNHLHFIWIQGADMTPEADRQRIDLWRSVNRDWHVHLWGRADLDVLMGGYPELAPVWAELSRALDNRPHDKAIMAKMSDFARLVLLNHRFDGDQHWNAYADTDTLPQRPLSSLFDDDLLYGVNLQKAADPRLNPAQSAVNWGNLDLVISQENRKLHDPKEVTNAVMLGRPGSPIITSLIRAGIPKRAEPTLVAWGPKMLKTNVPTTRRAKPGWRALVLPYHYFAFNPDQHLGQAAPVWTVAYHLDAYRWGEPGVKSRHLGRNTGPRKTALV